MKKYIILLLISSSLYSLPTNLDEWYQEKEELPPYFKTIIPTPYKDRQIIKNLQLIEPDIIISSFKFDMIDTVDMVTD